MPARDQRRPVGDALCRRVGFLFDLVVGDDAGNQALRPRLLGVEDAPFQKDFERRGPADQIHQAAQLGMGHDQPEPINRYTEAARFAANAQIAVGRYFEPAAHANALDHRHHGVAAVLEGRQCASHDGAVGPRLLDIGALVLELGDVVAGRKRLLARSAQHQTAQCVVGRELVDDLAQTLPHRLGQGVQLLRAVEHDRGDRAVTLH